MELIERGFGSLRGAPLNVSRCLGGMSNSHRLLPIIPLGALARADALARTLLRSHRLFTPPPQTNTVWCVCSAHKKNRTPTTRVNPPPIIPQGALARADALARTLHTAMGWNAAATLSVCVLLVGLALPQVNLYMYVCLCVCLCIYMCIYADIFIYMYICMYIYIDIYI